MTWEWSHIPEAYENARRNFMDLGESTIREIYTEWLVYQKVGDNPTLDDFDAVSEKGYIDRDQMWGWICELARCTNGGWEAHCCPYGCAIHQVSFTREVTND